MTRGMIVVWPEPQGPDRTIGGMKIRQGLQERQSPLSNVPLNGHGRPRKGRLMGIAFAKANGHGFRAAAPACPLA